MKRFIIALILTFSCAVTAFARDFYVDLCTADKVAVQFYVDIADDTSENVDKNIITALEKTAKALPVDRLITEEGYTLFLSYLTDESKDADAIVSIIAISDKACE